MIERMLSVDDAAKRCGVSKPSFLKLVDAGVLPPPFSYPNLKRFLWDIQGLDRCLDKFSGGDHDRAQSLETFRERLANAS